VGREIEQNPNTRRFRRRPASILYGVLPYTAGWAYFLRYGHPV
jgi:hypothetical protein